MTHYLLYWDHVEVGYEITLSITPDDGITVGGILTSTRPNQEDQQETLTHGDLVPEWTRKLKHQETLNLFLTLDFHTNDTQAVNIKGVCLKATGGVHQDSYDETYRGKRPLLTPVHVAAVP